MKLPTPFLCHVTLTIDWTLLLSQGCFCGYICMFHSGAHAGDQYHAVFLRLMMKAHRRQHPSFFPSRGAFVPDLLTGPHR